MTKIAIIPKLPMRRPKAIPPKPRNGRPSTYDEQIITEILWEIANGATGTAAARERGIPSTTWARWKQEIPGLADRVDEAEEQRWQRAQRRKAEDLSKRQIINKFKRERRSRLLRKKRQKEWVETVNRLGSENLARASGVVMPANVRYQYRFQRFLEYKSIGGYRNADKWNPFPRGRRARRTFREVQGLFNAAGVKAGETQTFHSGDREIDRAVSRIRE